MIVCSNTPYMYFNMDDIKKILIYIRIYLVHTGHHSSQVYRPDRHIQLCPRHRNESFVLDSLQQTPILQMCFKIIDYNITVIFCLNYFNFTS